MSPFNVRKLLVDVFDPMKDDRAIIIVDIPRGDIKDNENWRERRLMARAWHDEFEKLSDERGFFVHPLATYEATGSNNANLPEAFSIDGQKTDTANYIIKPNPPRTLLKGVESLSRPKLSSIHLSIDSL